PPPGRRRCAGHRAVAAAVAPAGARGRGAHAFRIRAAARSPTPKTETAAPLSLKASPETPDTPFPSDTTTYSFRSSHVQALTPGPLSRRPAPALRPGSGQRKNRPRHPAHRDLGRPLSVRGGGPRRPQADLYLGWHRQQGAAGDFGGHLRPAASAR